MAPTRPPKTRSGEASRHMGSGYVYSSEELERRMQDGSTPVVTVVRTKTGDRREVRAINIIGLALLIGAVIILGSAASNRYNNDGGEVLGARDGIENTEEAEAAVLEEEAAEEDNVARQTLDTVTREIKTVGLGLEREFREFRAGIIREEESNRD